MRWYAILTVHPTTTALVTTFLAVLVMATCPVARPIELIVAGCTLYGSTIEAHEYILGDFMIGELDEAIA